MSTNRMHLFGASTAESSLRSTGRLAVRSGAALAVVGGSLVWVVAPAGAADYGPTYDQTVTSTSDAPGSELVPGTLRYAIANAVDGDIIGFDLPSGSTIHITSPLSITTPLSTDPDGGLIVDGPGDDQLTIDADGTGRIFEVFYAYSSAPGPVTIDGLTLTGGSASDGGAILSKQADLLVEDVTVTGNEATDGGGISIRSGSLELVDSTVSGNTADQDGGGIYVRGGYAVGAAAFAPIVSTSVDGVTITNSVISDNVADADASECGGNYYGGGLAVRGVAGNVTINGSTFAGNSAPIAGGAGIFEVTGNVTVSGSTVGGQGAGDGNTACESAAGLGIASVSGQTRIADTDVINNYLGPGKYGSAIGGGVALGGLFDGQITGSTISGNASSFYGGGLVVATYELGIATGAPASLSAVSTNPVVVIDTEISNNTATIGGNVLAFGADLRLLSSQVTGDIGTPGALFGAGVAVKYANVDIDDTDITGNYAYFGGGGVFVKYSADVNITSSTISGNRAKYIGGGILTGFNGPSGSEYASSVHLGTTTVSGNVAAAGGGIAATNYDQVEVVQSTISGTNQAIDDPETSFPYEGVGGGVLVNNYAFLRMENSTVSGNTADASGGGIAVVSNDAEADIKYSTIVENTAAYGGGIVVQAPDINTVTLGNTIVANNTEYDVVGPVDAAYSLIEDDSDETTITNGGNNLLGIDPELGALQDNGGPTETHLPLLGSPVVDAGVEAPDVTVDQRGEIRPLGSAADIGAVEGEGSAVAAAVVKVVATTPEAVEGGAPGLFTFTRTGSTSAALTIAYTLSGTATPGDDYVALGTVTFPAGKSSVTKQVIAVDDGIDEGDETVIVSLQPGSGYTMATPVSATVTIVDEATANPDPCTDVADAGFTDVDGSNVHKDAIDCLKALGITIGGPNGLPADQYGPGQDVTRGQIATFLARLIAKAGVDLPTDAPDAFADDDGNVHEDDINTLVAAGVIEGLPDGTFGIGQSVRRDQMASLLARAYEYITGSPLPAGPDAFTDDDGNVHEDNINALAAASIVQGTATPGIYDPSGNVRRDQMASFLIRLAQLLASEGHFTNQVDDTTTA